MGDSRNARLSRSMSAPSPTAARTLSSSRLPMPNFNTSTR